MTNETDKKRDYGNGLTVMDIDITQRNHGNTRHHFNRELCTAHTHSPTITYVPKILMLVSPIHVCVVTTNSVVLRYRGLWKVIKKLTFINWLWGFVWETPGTLPCGDINRAHCP